MSETARLGRTRSRRAPARLLALTALMAMVPLAPATGAPSPGVWSTDVASPAKTVILAARLAGGAGKGWVLASNGHGHFELYDPEDNLWYPVARGFARSDTDKRQLLLTLTPLESGSVLVGHGSSGHPYVPMYRLDLGDPTDEGDDKWTPVPESVRRANYYSTTLIEGTVEQCGENCGKVLVAGGGNDSTPRETNPTNDPSQRSTAELYDPVQNEFTLTGPIPGDGLLNHVAVALGDGRVLATGGGFIPEAFLFDPISATWSRAADPPRDMRLSPGVRLADGRALVMHFLGYAVFDPAGGEINPATGRPVGSWTAVQTCPGQDVVCVDPVLLPDGTVLARALRMHTTPEDKRVFLFDPASIGDATTPDWTEVASSPLFIDALTLLTGTQEQCGARCGKVLGAGNSGYRQVYSRRDSPGTAALYTPGSGFALAELSPPAGFACGGQSVTISGTELQKVSQVSFGQAPPITVGPEHIAAGGTRLTVKSPPHLPGRVDVSVRAEGRTLRVPGSGFTYQAVPAPTVESLSPPRGPALGATRVTIAGSFAAECVKEVRFGETPAASARVGGADPGEAAQTIEVVSPPLDPGRVRVSVVVDTGPAPPPGPLPTLPSPTLPTLPTGAAASGDADVFTVFPVVAGVAPVSGPLGGGNEVTIAGRGLGGASEVRFAGAAAQVTRRAPTELVVVAPSSAVAEPVVVRVVAGGVPSPDDVIYTYVAPQVAPSGPRDPEPGSGPPRQDNPPVQSAPPGGTGSPSPANAPSPSPAPGAASAPAPGPAPAPAPGPAPVAKPTPVQLPVAVPAPAPAPVPGHIPTQVPSGAVPPVASPVAGAAPAPAQAAPGPAPTPGSTQAGAGAGEEDRQARGSTRHAMDLAASLALGGAGATACFTWLALARAAPARRRRTSNAPRPRPKGAY